MAARVRRDDIVEVIAGAHKGARGKVLRIDIEHQRVVVEGVNMVYRHVRKSRQHPQGGRIQKEAPIHLSNVMPLDPRTGKRTRVRFTLKHPAAGERVAKQRVSTSGTVLSDVTRGTDEMKAGQR
ncbi:MAG: 50S ribosomal protein L24 [Phycisphaerae bacterium]|jgi:large subunit ribosomal protein L24